MSCPVLSTNLTLDCRDAIGGVDEIYITELENVSSVGTASGVVTGITMAVGKVFYKYQGRKGAIEAKSDLGGDVASGTGFQNHQVILQADKFDAAKSYELRKTQKKPMAIIAKDANGTFMLYGWPRGVDATAGTGQTGKAAADMNGYTITYSGEQPDYPYGISSALVASVAAS